MAATDSRCRKQILSEHFDAVPFEDDWEPRYNIAPTQPVPVIRQTPNFRELTLMRWGLIPSWATDPSIGLKTPYCFEVGDGEMFAFAGLWDRWIDPQGKEIESCTIITTTPNSHLADIHDRMPVILPSGAYSSWLNPAMRDSRTALGWLVPYAGEMRRYPVSTRINQVQNDDEECGKQVELEGAPQGQLFT